MFIVGTTLAAAGAASAAAGCAPIHLQTGLSTTPGVSTPAVSVSFAVCAAYGFLAAPAGGCYGRTPAAAVAARRARLLQLNTLLYSHQQQLSYHSQQQQQQQQLQYQQQQQQQVLWQTPSQQHPSQQQQPGQLQGQTVYGASDGSPDPLPALLSLAQPYSPAVAALLIASHPPLLLATATATLPALATAIATERTALARARSRLDAVEGKIFSVLDTSTAALREAGVVLPSMSVASPYDSSDSGLTSGAKGGLTSAPGSLTSAQDAMLRRHARARFESRVVALLLHGLDVKESYLAQQQATVVQLALTLGGLAQEFAVTMENYDYSITTLSTASTQQPLPGVRGNAPRLAGGVIPPVPLAAQKAGYIQQQQQQQQQQYAGGLRPPVPLGASVNTASSSGGGVHALSQAQLQQLSQLQQQRHSAAAHFASLAAGARAEAVRTQLENDAVLLRHGRAAEGELAALAAAAGWATVITSKSSSASTRGTGGTTGACGPSTAACTDAVSAEVVVLDTSAFFPAAQNNAHSTALVVASSSRPSTPRIGPGADPGAAALNNPASSSGAPGNGSVAPPPIPTTPRRTSVVAAAGANFNLSRSQTPSSSSSSSQGQGPGQLSQSQVLTIAPGALIPGVSPTDPCGLISLLLSPHGTLPGTRTVSFVVSKQNIN